MKNYWGKLKSAFPPSLFAALRCFVLCGVHFLFGSYVEIFIIHQKINLFLSDKKGVQRLENTLILLMIVLTSWTEYQLLKMGFTG